MTTNLGSSKIFAIVSDYDGTLCPTGNIRNSDQNKVPTELASILFEISKVVPICILTSKDYSFVREKVPFASVVSCILGIETLTIDAPHPRIKSRRLLVNHNLLQNNASILEEVVNDLSSRFPDVAIERKLTSDGYLAGITFDWRDQEDWNKYSNSVPKYVEESLTTAHGHQSASPSGMYVQTYRSHPFVDVYTARCDKGIGLDAITSELQYTPDKGKVMYLGDSDNDNPAFRKAGITIGVRSDSRLKPKLDCQYYIDFRDLVAFLNELKDNSFALKTNLLYYD